MTEILIPILCTVPNKLFVTLHPPGTTIGTQYDHLATTLHFERPAPTPATTDFTNDDLTVTLTPRGLASRTINLGQHNDYAIPNYFTATRELQLNVAFVRNGLIIANSNVITCTFRAGATMPPTGSDPQADAYVATLHYDTTTEMLTGTNIAGNTLTTTQIPRGGSPGPDPEPTAPSLLDYSNDTPALFFSAPSLDGWGGKEDERTITATFKHSGKTLFTEWATIKPQGTSSLSYEKKNFTLTFYTDSTADIKKPINVVDSWKAQSKYVLKANYVDTSHSRNLVGCKISAALQAQYDVLPQAPFQGLVQGFPIALYCNNEFYGIYTFNIPKDAWQFGMDTENPAHTLLCLESQTGSCTFRSLADPASGEWSIEAGEDTEANIYTKLNRLIAWVMDADDARFRSEFSQYLNLDSTLNYYLFVYFAQAIDNLAKNMLLATYDGQVWYPSIYDVDTLWGVHWAGTMVLSASYQCPQQYECPNSLLWEKVTRVFYPELCERAADLFDTHLNAATALYETRRFMLSIPQRMYSDDLRRWASLSNMIDTYPQIQANMAVREKMYLYNFMTPTSRHSKLIYRLPAPVTTTESQPYDTGLKLFNRDNNDFTLFAKFDRHPPAHQYDSCSYMSCFDETGSGYRGLLIRRSGSSDDILNMLLGSLYSGQFTFTPDETTLSVCFKCSGLNWNTVLGNSTNVFQNTYTSEVAPFDWTLVIGAQRNSNGDFQYMSAITCQKLEVYDGGFSDQVCREYLTTF